jgi:uncharacterized membrane-anchored protein
MSPKAELILGSVLLGFALVQFFFGGIITNEWKIIKRKEHPFIFWVAILVTFSLGAIAIIQATFRVA